MKTQTTDTKLQSLYAHSAAPTKCYNMKLVKRSLTEAELANLKSRSRCPMCSKYGHWAVEHNEDESLKPGVRATEDPATGGNVEPNTKSGTETFHVVELTSKFDPMKGFKGFRVPLLDDVAPFSAVGLNEFEMLELLLLPDWRGKFYPLPDAISHHWFCQYGVRGQKSPAKRSLGSVILRGRCDGGTAVQIRYLIIDGSSQSVVGRNVTRKCNIIHVRKKKLQLP